MFVFLVVLLAQVVPPLDDAPPLVQLEDIASLQTRWQELHSACRSLPDGSIEAENACHGRDVTHVELGRRGWCLRQSGIQIEWDMCPRR
jgi:hypothetical protein